MAARTLSLRGGLFVKLALGSAEADVCHVIFELLPVFVVPTVAISVPVLSVVVESCEAGREAADGADGEQYNPESSSHDSSSSAVGGAAAVAMVVAVVMP